MPLEKTPQVALRAKYVFPVEGPPIEGGVVTLSGEQIAAVGKSSDAVAVRDLGNVAILPGLVNTHTHLEFSSLDEPLGRPGMALPDWIRQVIAYRGRGDLNVPSAIANGLAECAASGTTMLGEIATASSEAYRRHSQSIDLTLLHEVIGFSEPRSASAYDAAIDRLESFNTSSDVRSGFSPHAPYTVHPKLLERLVEYSAKRRLPLAMHLAESQEELQLLRDGNGPLRDLLEERSMWDATAIPQGSIPLDYLRVLTRAPRAIVIHGNYLSTAEIEFLARERARMSVVYCPRTHAYFQHAPYPLKTMLAAGVHVALGTDSRASNPDLCLLGEMRCVAQQHSLSPTEIVRLGTLAGAEALGWSSSIGSITPGKWADLIAVPCGAADPAEAVLQHEGPPSYVWLRGKKIVAS